MENIVNHLIKLPMYNYGSFSEEDEAVLRTATWVLCGDDIDKVNILEEIIKAHIRNKELEIAFSNAGSSQ